MIEKYFIGDPLKKLWPGGKYYFTMDNDGIVQVNYRQTNYRAADVKPRYHPTAISAFALSQFNRFMDTGEDQFKKCFLKYSDWLADHLSERNRFAAWNFDFDWKSPGYKCSAPFISSMTQGMGISVLVRAWALTNDMGYLAAAKRALSAFETSVDQGGLLRNGKHGDVWYEAAPSPIGAQVLNEFLFALIGLHEISQCTGNSQAKELFDRGIETARRHLRKFDLNLVLFRWSRYDNKLLFYSGDKYHDIQKEQVKWLYKVSGDDIFGEYCRKWECWQKKWASRHHFSAKRLFELVYFLLYGRFLRFFTKYLQG